MNVNLNDINYSYYWWKTAQIFETIHHINKVMTFLPLSGILEHDIYDMHKFFQH